MSAVLDILRSFSGDGSRYALDHLHLIEDRCMLFELAKNFEDEEKIKFYIYLLMVMLVFGFDL
jgi:hypothetical protein